MSATPILYPENTSELANYLTIVDIPKVEKKKMEEDFKEGRGVKSERILKYNEYPINTEVSLEEFKKVAKKC
jgi:hypothetical protein